MDKVDQKPQTILELAKIMKEIGKEGLAEEFAKIPIRNPKGSFTIFKEAKNLNRNRYPFFIVEDSTIVFLSSKTGDGESASDYINANYVDGYEQKNAYIATQGPIASTTVDFWQMIWDQKCLVIVMTTDVNEEGIDKCHQYWEKNVGDSVAYGNFTIETKCVEPNDGYTVSTLELKNEKTNETRKVSHFLCYSWPDFDAPLSPKALLKYVIQVRATQAEMVKTLGDNWKGHPLGPSILVHCSAGIGRTGAFILLDFSILRLEGEGTVDLRGTLIKIRDQRSLAIGMPSQYTFVHRALIEYALDRGLLSFDINPKDFDDNVELDAIHRVKVNKLIADAKKALNKQVQA